VRSARVLALDRRADLALLAVPRLRGAGLETATTGSEDRVDVVVVRDGRVVTIATSVRRSIDARVSAPGAGRALRRPALELEARVMSGDSGAPVLTADGELAGVLFARSRNRPDTAYAVDAVAVERVLVEFLADSEG
jgi:S1-C subfamily serine protease